MYFSFLALLRVRQTDLELGAPIASRVVLGPQSGRCKKSKGRDLSERILLPSSSFRSVSVKSAQRPSWVGSVVVVVDSAVVVGSSDSKRGNTPQRERTLRSWRSVPSKKRAEQDKCNGLPPASSLTPRPRPSLSGHAVSRERARALVRRPE